MDRGTWQATVHGSQDSDTTEQLNHHCGKTRKRLKRRVVKMQPSVTSSLKMPMKISMKAKKGKIKRREESGKSNVTDEMKDSFKKERVLENLKC